MLNEVLDEKTMSKIKESIHNGDSILIIGHTGTGKTTLLNSLMKLIPNDKKVTYIKDECGELDIPDNHQSLKIDGDFINALMTDPDVIVANEIRGPEIDEFIRTLNCGVSGMATMHSTEIISNMFDNMEESMNDKQSHSDNLELIQRALDLIIVMGNEVIDDELNENEFELNRQVINVKRVSKEFYVNDNGIKSIKLLSI